MTMEERVSRVFAAVFQVPPESVPTAFREQSMSTWDSLMHLNLALALEDEFGIRFEDEEFAKLDSFDAAVNMIRAKGH
jgi:acyl carrier protein